MRWRAPASARAGDDSIQYFRSPFPTECKAAEATSDIYIEYAAGMARRSFEVFADRTLVAPYDVGIPEVDSDEMLRAAREALDPDGAPIDPRLSSCATWRSAPWKDYANFSTTTSAPVSAMFPCWRQK